MARDTSTSDLLPTPVGPFSPAVRAHGLTFISGQVAQDPATGKLIEGDVGRQTEQAMRNLVGVLVAVAKDLDDVVRVGVYLTDMADYPKMNEVYAKYFNSPCPARTAIGVAALPLGALVEIDAIVG